MIGLIRVVSVLILTCSGFCAGAGELPSPFVADYSLHSMGTRFASMRRSFTVRENGEYEYFSETSTVGLLAMIRKDRVLEKSIWHFAADRLQPLHYSYEHTGGKRNRNVIINFDWAARIITNSINGSSWQMPIQAYIMDKLLYQLAIMYDLENGMQQISYAIADGGKIKTYDFELLSEETIATPIGEYRSVKLVRHKSNSDQETIIWCARELGYLPIKVENTEDNGRKTTAVIEALSGSRYGTLTSSR